MNINFNELKGIGSYNFKKDSSIWVSFENISRISEKHMKKAHFVVMNPKTDEVLFVSKKDCLEFVKGVKYVNQSKTWFPHFEPVDYIRLRFKEDYKSKKEHKRFMDFCANRRSGNQIFELFSDRLNSFNYYPTTEESALFELSCKK